MKFFIMSFVLSSSIAYSEIKTGYPKNIVAVEEGVAFELDCKPASSRLDFLREIKTQLTELNTLVFENTCELMNHIYGSHAPCNSSSPHISTNDSCTMGFSYRDFFIDANAKNYAGYVNVLNMAFNSGKKMRIEFDVFPVEFQEDEIVIKKFLISE
ncbi:MAG: hypothetical protein KBD78_13240 [Oligoflexales bacterium]|nr:hypothetical protein [Oligoflexales bacterium]